MSAVVRQRILQNAERIVNAQLGLAEGCAFLFHRGKGAKAKTDVVTSPETIRRFLDGELSEDDGYYYIHTERPSNFAIDSMFNRALGKPVETMEVSAPGGGPVRVQFVDA